MCAKNLSNKEMTKIKVVEFVKWRNKSCRNDQNKLYETCVRLVNKFMSQKMSQSLSNSIMWQSLCPIISHDNNIAQLGIFLMCLILLCWLHENSYGNIN